MRVRMRCTRRYTHDGFGLRVYQRGRRYEVGAVLAERLFRDGCAEIDNSTVLAQEEPFMALFPRRLLTRVAEPAAEPVTLSEAKHYLRVDHSSDDTLITDMIVAARIAAEEFLRRSLITQSWKLAYDDYIPAAVELTKGPVQSITSVSLVDNEGVVTAVDSNTYRLNAALDVLNLDSVFYSHRIEIVYVCGYGAAGAVPKPVKYGLLAHLSAFYDSRGNDAVMIPQEALALYAPFREIRA